MSKTIAILGMGKSGQSAARLALSLGHNVHCIDANPTAPTISGCHCHYATDVDISFVQEIVVSPGVPQHNAIIQQAQKLSIPISGELGFAAQHLSTPLVAITGTNGKSSTAFYTHQLLQQLGQRSFIGGNFGTALSEMALQEDQYDIGVVEVSSYQMEFPNGFCPDVAVALNLSPDHLKRHGTMEVYAEMKRRIFAEQSSEQISIVTKGETELTPKHRTTLWWIGDFPGAKIEANTLRIKTPEKSIDLSLNTLGLMGLHNQQNVMAACLILHGRGLDIQHLNLALLKPLEHRLETIQMNDGIVWVNDSKATNIEAASAGIQAIGAQQIVLLGGAGKENANYQRLLPLLRQHAQDIICFGRSGEEIHQQLQNCGLSLHLCSHLDKAVGLAQRLAKKNMYIVLSPACASFDEFRNFEHRGDVFKQLIHLKEFS